MGENILINLKLPVVRDTKKSYINKPRSMEYQEYLAKRKRVKTPNRFITNKEMRSLGLNFEGVLRSKKPVYFSPPDKLIFEYEESYNSLRTQEISSLGRYADLGVIRIIETNMFESPQTATLINTLVNRKNCITQLHFTKCNFGIEGSIQLQYLLKYHNSLNKLVLEECKNLQMKPISRGLKISGLGELSLWRCNLGEVEISHIARSLRENYYLRTLNLSYNKLNNKGALYLSVMLDSNQTLEELILDSTEIEDPGGKSLAASLRTNSTLKFMSLRDNALGDHGLGYLGQVAGDKHRQGQELRFDVANNKTSKHAEYIFAMKARVKSRSPHREHGRYIFGYKLLQLLESRQREEIFLVEGKSGEQLLMKEINIGGRDKYFAPHLQYQIALLRILHHPNIVHLHSAFTKNKCFYIVRESLNKTMDVIFHEQEFWDVGDKEDTGKLRTCPFKREKVYQIGCQVAQGLYILHKLGIPHLTLNSSNIFMQGMERVKISDFGLGENEFPRKIGGSGNIENIYENGHYIPQEMKEEEEYEYEPDIFSLGVLLYRLSTGKYPGPSSIGEEYPEKYREQVERMLSGKSNIRPSISSTLSTLHTLYFNNNSRGGGFTIRGERKSMENYVKKSKSVGMVECYTQINGVYHHALFTPNMIDEISMLYLLQGLHPFPSLPSPPSSLH